MLNITKGRIYRAQKIVLYGSEGVGKSTLASQFPDPLFIDTEGGTSHLDVKRVDKPQTWDELLQIVKEVAKTPTVCRTLVIDTADWAEQLAVAHLCKKNKWASIESANYGRGFTMLAETYTVLLAACDEVLKAGVNVVITAHAKMRKFEQPDEMGAYDRWELKLSKQTAPLLKEWCDHLLFLNYQTYVTTSENGTKKGQGGKRVIYTSHHPAWDAKSRAGLPDVVDLAYENIAAIVENVPTEEQKQPEEREAVTKLRALMQEADITEPQLMAVVAAKGHAEPDTPISEYPDKIINGWIIRYWGRIVPLCKEN